ncbi:MAG TPA: hypothetical protein DCP92_07725 [Nitrospiraceae bacterium]|nr:hypothetical protein [Nitrospiraceae bacterium]
MKRFHRALPTLVCFFSCLLFYGHSEAAIDITAQPAANGNVIVSAGYGTNCDVSPYIAITASPGIGGCNGPGNCNNWGGWYVDGFFISAVDNVNNHLSSGQNFVTYWARGNGQDMPCNCVCQQGVQNAIVSVYVGNSCDSVNGACCTGRCSCTATKMGSSANYASGNLYDTLDIVSPHGGGLSASFSLSYNSLDFSVGRLGGKWTHNYNMRILPAGTSLLLIDGDGKRLFFADDGTGTGTYRPPQNAGDYSTITFPAGMYQLTKKEGTIYQFDSASGKLLSITDRNGNSITLAYNGSYLATITDQYGRSIGLSYDSLYRIASVTDFASGATLIGYDANGMLATVTDPAGNAWNYTYDSLGNMLSKTDPIGNVTTYTYDTQVRITSSTTPAGTKTIAYGTGNVATITERDGGAWTYTYDPTVSAAIAVTGPNNATTTSTYDANGNLLSKTDAKGNTTTYTYDSNGNMLTMTDALNNTTTYTYNQYGQMTSATDPQGNLTVYNFDSSGNLLSVTDPSGAKTIYQYDQRGNVVSTTSASGQTTTISYDSYGNRSAITDPAGAVTTYTYDISSNMLSQTDPAGNTTTFQYNALNQLVSVTDPLGNVTTYTYDAKGNRASVTDPRGKVTSYVYNYNNDPTKVTDPLGNVTTNTYTSTAGGGCTSCGAGSGDKLASVTDANNHTISYQYNLMGKLTNMTDQLGNSETYTYDLNDNLRTMTDRKGQTTAYTYDSLNRVTRVDYADGSYTTYTYDTTGKVTTITDSVSGTITYTYSTSTSGGPVGKVLSETTPLGSISYTYDAIGRRTSMTVLGQPVVNYSYDADSRLTGLSTIINGNASSFGIGYDTLGRRASLTLPNGVTSVYTFDNGSRLLNLQHLGPLTQVLESLSYTYDANGNRLSMNRSPLPLPLPQAASNTSYSAANQMLSFSDKNITYDADGNMASVTNSCGTTTYTWDARNRLVGINGFNPDCSQLAASFEYDALGRRIQKTINGLTIQYVYDGVDIIQEIENGQVTANYVRTLSIDEPLARIKSDGTVRYYQRDALGSVIALTDGTGAVQTTYTYDPFGNVTVTGETSDNPFQYTGRENDGTGLYYYRARYYSSELQRFISEDPIRFKGGINFYAYVKDNPTNYTDPTGKGGLCKVICYVTCPIICNFIAHRACNLCLMLPPPASFICFAGCLVGGNLACEYGCHKLCDSLCDDNKCSSSGSGGSGGPGTGGCGPGSVPIGGGMCYSDPGMGLQ